MKNKSISTWLIFSFGALIMYFAYYISLDITNKIYDYLRDNNHTLARIYQLSVFTPIFIFSLSTFIYGKIQGKNIKTEKNKIYMVLFWIIGAIVISVAALLCFPDYFYVFAVGALLNILPLVIKLLIHLFVLCKFKSAAKSVN